MVRMREGQHVVQWSVIWCMLVGITYGESWQAGAAKTSITPEVGVWMAGYGDRDHPSEGQLTDLWAKALCLQDTQGRRGLLVTLDLVGIDRELSQAICQHLMTKHGLTRAQIAICVSHTHTGPVVGGNLASMHYRLLDPAQQHRVAQYAQVLQQRVIEVADNAVAQLKPCQIAWGNGRATFAVNRRNNAEKEVATLRAQGRLMGPVDHDVPVLSIRAMDGTHLAIVFGYACHATVLNGYQWSGDYPGFAQAALEEDFPGAIALFWAGCGADQNPLPRRQVELAQRYGHELAGAVKQTLEDALRPVTGSLEFDYTEVPLQLDTLPSRAELESDCNSENRYVAARAQMLLETLQQGQALSSVYPYPMSRWAVGDDVEWLFLGGEVTVDYSLRAKRERRGVATWVSGYAHDVMAYIPSHRVWQEGGYEGAGAMVYYGLPSRWSEQVESQIVAQIARWPVASSRATTSAK